MERSCTRETSGWHRGKLPEWSSCILGAGTGLHVTVECLNLLHSRVVLPPPNTSLLFPLEIEVYYNTCHSKANFSSSHGMMVPFCVLIAVVLMWTCQHSLNLTYKICVFYCAEIISQQSRFNKNSKWKGTPYKITENLNFTYILFPIRWFIPIVVVVVAFSRVKDIQSVYLDTTFCDPKFYQIPSRVSLAGEVGW